MMLMGCLAPFFGEGFLHSCGDGVSDGVAPKYFFRDPVKEHTPRGHGELSFEVVILNGGGRFIELDATLAKAGQDVVVVTC